MQTSRVIDFPCSTGRGCICFPLAHLDDESVFDSRCAAERLDKGEYVSTPSGSIKSYCGLRRQMRVILFEGRFQNLI